MDLGLRLFGREYALLTGADAASALTRKALPPLQSLNPSASGWWPWGVIRESFTGAWQQNVEMRADTALSYYAVYACVRLIATDIGKMCLYLVEEDENYVWTRTESTAFSPVLRRPNRYQTFAKFAESWMLSKLLNGNTYVLVRRDRRGVVNEMHILDPQRVKPLVTQDGAIWYEIRRDDLSGLPQESVTLPASQIGHDTYITPFHPLMGLSPIFACALSITEGLAIQTGSKTFFENGGQPGGMLTAPGAISDETVARLQATLKAKNPGETLVGGDGLKYDKFTMTAVDSELIKQLQMSAEQVCSAFGVPPYLVDIGPPPPYANFEPLLLKYHSQCIQSLATNFENTLDRLLGLETPIDGRQLGTEFDIDDLIWMDNATRVESASKAINGGMSFNEARWKYYGLGPVDGGETPYSQQQYWPLSQLAKREIPAVPASPPSVEADQEDIETEDDAMDLAAFATLVHQKSLEAGLYA